MDIDHLLGWPECYLLSKKFSNKQIFFCLQQSKKKEKPNPNVSTKAFYGVYDQMFQLLSQDMGIMPDYLTPCCAEVNADNNGVSGAQRIL